MVPFTKEQTIYKKRQTKLRKDKQNLNVRKEGEAKQIQPNKYRDIAKERGHFTCPSDSTNKLQQVYKDKMHTNFTQIQI